MCMSNRVGKTSCAVLVFEWKIKREFRLNGPLHRKRISDSILDIPSDVDRDCVTWVTAKEKASEYSCPTCQIQPGALDVWLSDSRMHRSEPEVQNWENAEKWRSSRIHKYAWNNSYIRVHFDRFTSWNQSGVVFFFFFHFDYSVGRKCSFAAHSLSKRNEIFRLVNFLIEIINWMQAVSCAAADSSSNKKKK